jgi:hypothetical protein
LGKLISLYLILISYIFKKEKWKTKNGKQLKQRLVENKGWKTK